MKVNKNSWHYKTACHGNTDAIFQSEELYGTINFCKYCRKALVGLLKYISEGFVVLFGMLLGVGFLWGAFSCLVFAFSGLTGIYLPNLVHIEMGAVTGVIIICCNVIALIVGSLLYKHGDIKFLPDYLSKYLPERAKVNKTTKPNILVEYVKAKKNKFCPLIELDKE